MASYTKLTYHVVFGTKYRVKSIREQIREPLYRYVSEIYSGPGWTSDRNRRH